jgi:hypothetical protein
VCGGPPATTAVGVARTPLVRHRRYPRDLGGPQTRRHRCRGAGSRPRVFRALDPPTSTQARRLKVGDAPYVMGPHVLDTVLVKKELSRARQHPTSRSRPRPF